MTSTRISISLGLSGERVGGFALVVLGRLVTITCSVLQAEITRSGNASSCHRAQPGLHRWLVLDDQERAGQHGFEVSDDGCAMGRVEASEPVGELPERPATLNRRQRQS